MTMRPEVSVITVTYNQALTIARTLDSILAQECDFDYEIVIGEDCSTDDTLDICRRYAAAHPDKNQVAAQYRQQGCHRQLLRLHHGVSR